MCYVGLWEFYRLIYSISKLIFVENETYEFLFPIKTRYWLLKKINFQHSILMTLVTYLLIIERTGRNRTVDTPSISTTHCVQSLLLFCWYGCNCS